VGTTIYQVPFRGNIFVLISFASLFLFAVLSLGFLISVVTKSQQLAYQVAMLSSFLPTFLFSGFLFPISSMPRALQIFACLIPGKYFVKIARDLFLKGGGWGHLYTEGLILLGFSVLLIFAASRKFKKRLGH